VEGDFDLFLPVVGFGEVFEGDFERAVGRLVMVEFEGGVLFILEGV
jgi:hypothetical protein